MVKHPSLHLVLSLSVLLLASVPMLNALSTPGCALLRLYLMAR
jgi:hypothetical protein